MGSPPPRRAATGMRWRRVIVAVVLTTVALVLAGIVDLASDDASTPVGSGPHTTARSAPPAPSATSPATSPVAPSASASRLPGVAEPPPGRDAPTRRDTAEPPATTTGRQRPTRACRYIPFGRSVRPVGLPPRRPQAANRLVLQLRLGTSRLVHTVVIALLPRNAPCAVNSVSHLARAGFYNRTSCPRLTTRWIFVLQCGDPSGTGAGGPGYRFRAEVGGHETYPAGTVAMALGTPNTTGSQFFIVYRTARLDPSFPIVGRVVRGLKVVATDARHGAHPTYRVGDGFPTVPVHIVSAAAGCAPPRGTRGAALRVARCPVRTLPQ